MDPKTDYKNYFNLDVFEMTEDKWSYLSGIYDIYEIPWRQIVKYPNLDKRIIFTFSRHFYINDLFQYQQFTEDELYKILTRETLSAKKITSLIRFQKISEEFVMKLFTDRLLSLQPLPAFLDEYFFENIDVDQIHELLSKLHGTNFENMCFRAMCANQPLKEFQIKKYISKMQFVELSINPNLKISKKLKIEIMDRANFLQFMKYMKNPTLKSEVYIEI